KHLPILVAHVLRSICEIRSAVKRVLPDAERRRKDMGEISIMMTFVLNAIARLHRDETGQGLVEYLLILALLAFAATAGMGSLASYLNLAFSDVRSLLNA